MKQRSVMSHQFSQVPAVEMQRSSFDRSHAHKTTFNGGWLVPILVDEALPGDTFNCKMTGFARLATPIFPVMDNMHMETFFFAVPNRLVWENWQKFNGEQDAPGESTDYLVPILDWAGDVVKEEELSDYLGLPLGQSPANTSSLFHRAYTLIWNEWFRDQNLEDPEPLDKGDGPDDHATFIRKRRGKRHDYFTSALPWPQKGQPVSIGLSGSAPVSRLSQTPPTFVDALGDDSNRFNLGVQAGADDRITREGDQTIESAVIWGPNTTDSQLQAILDDVSAVSINDLREAFQIQRLLERDARGGTRYTEIIRSHFGVVSPDARLQRPEYLGGGSSPVIITPVAQTSNTEDTVSPQGNLAAFGTAALHNHGFTKSFTEHCIIIGLVSVRADLTYQQGTNRMFNRSTRFDYYWPALANLGEQSVLNKEIYTQSNAADDDVFGYQERYAEYRYKPSQISGKFRSGALAPLDAWHLSQDFESLPALNTSFIRDNPPIDRVIAVPSEPHFIFDSFFSMRCARPMPLYGVPGLIDHF